MLASEKLRFQLRRDHVPWSTTVNPGRFAKVEVEEGDVLFITEINLFSTKKKGLAEIYIGINKTKDDFLIGTLCGSTMPLLRTGLIVTESCTLGHSGYNPVSFTGYNSRRRKRRRVTQPQTINTGAQDESGSAWPLGLELTINVLAQMNCCDVAAAESVCKIFYEAGSSPVSYSNVDLYHMPHAEDLDALVMIRRSHGQLSSLVLGTGLPTMLYTARCLAPLNSSENCLKKLHLFRLDAINDDNLRPPLSCCIHLKDLEIELRHVTVEGLLAILGGRPFNKLERVIYNPPILNMFQNKISDHCLENFLEQCGAIGFLRLTHVFVKDAQVARILATRGLKYLNLMYSVGFNGEFFIDERSKNSGIQVLVLQHCCGLSDYRITEFVGLLEREDYMNNMREIYLTGKKGSEKRRGITKLKTARPMIKILTSTEKTTDKGYTEDTDYERINERITKARRKPSTLFEGISDFAFTDSDNSQPSEDPPVNFRFNPTDDDDLYDEELQSPKERSDDDYSSEEERSNAVGNPGRRFQLIELTDDEEEARHNNPKYSSELDLDYCHDTDLEDSRFADQEAARRSWKAKRKEGSRFTYEELHRVKLEEYNTVKMSKKYPEDYVGGNYKDRPSDGELRLRRRFIYW